MLPNLLDAIVLITSYDADNLNFGTGYIIRRAGDTAYILTCAHVVRDVGEEAIKVNNEKGELVVSGDHLNLDLAVVKVEGMSKTACIPDRWDGSRDLETEFQLAGFHSFDRKAKSFAIQELKGALGGLTQITTRTPFNPTRAWKLILADGDIQDGYSGAPVVEPDTGAVLGIVSHRVQKGVGIAISIEQLDRIWQPIDKRELRNALMQLGYRDQARMFYRMIRKNPFGAYVIHGPTEKYGQQWLVNRLVRQFLPSSMTAMKFRVGLNRVGRRNDVSGLWEDLANEVHCDRRSIPMDIAKQTIEWWKNQDIILAFYDVNCLSEQLYNKLIHDFWLPLVNEAEGFRSIGCPHKLLMFLVDNEGAAAKHKIQMTEQIDIASTLHTPLKSPLLQEFSEQELEDWVINQYSYLPEDLKEDVGDLLEASDGGIPEWTFVEICKRCGYDWRTESQSWCSI